jgi:DNA-binding MarR family transcriptional regulator
LEQETDIVLIATELRVVLGRLLRRLRAEPGAFPPSHGLVLGRLDREGAQSVSDLAAAERMRPQSMAQTVKELECDGLVARRPDPHDRRRAPVDLTERGRAVLEAERHRREGWLASAIERDLSLAERGTLAQAVELLQRLSEG